MGAAFIVLVHHRRGRPTRTDFAAYDAAVRVAKERMKDPSVTRVEITHDARLLWTCGAWWPGTREEVIASRDQ